jgi:hypothetical protein
MEIPLIAGILILMMGAGCFFVGKGTGVFRFFGSRQILGRGYEF